MAPSLACARAGGPPIRWQALADLCLRSAIDEDGAMRWCATLLGLLAMAACSGDDGGPVDPHAIRSCDDAWKRNGYTDCEAACVNSSAALGASGPSCRASDPIGVVSCSKTFVFEGVTGCCAANEPQVLFAECQ
jgi:hypothetical protein